MLHSGICAQGTQRRVCPLLSNAFFDLHGALQLFAEVIVPDMPGDGSEDPPTVEAWVSRILEVCGTGAAQLRRTLLVGHCVGFQACLRAIPLLVHHIAGLVGVAAWFSIDKPWRALGPWLHDFPSYEAAHAKCRRVLCLISDNDPFTKDHEKTRRQLEERTGALVIVLPGAKHFNAPEEDELFKRVCAMARIIVDPNEEEEPTRQEPAKSSSKEPAKVEKVPAKEKEAAERAERSSEDEKERTLGKTISRLTSRLFGAK